MLPPCLRKGAPWHLRYDVLIVSSNRLQLHAYLGLSVVNISMSSSLGSGWVCNRLLKPGRFVVDVFKDLSQQFFGNDGRKDLAGFRGSLRIGYDLIKFVSRDKSGIRTPSPWV